MTGSNDHGKPPPQYYDVPTHDISHHTYGDNDGVAFVCGGISSLYYDDICIIHKGDDTQRDKDESH